MVEINAGFVEEGSPINVLVTREDELAPSLEEGEAIAQQIEVELFANKRARNYPDAK